MSRLLGIPVFLDPGLLEPGRAIDGSGHRLRRRRRSDYLDGFAARLTGQYSRFGALLDPVVDRLLVISGMAVAYHFSLLPRWAIIVVVAREVFMLAISRYAMTRGIDIKINWPGRLGVGPTMGAPFFAMAGVHWLALVMLYVGMALALSATVLYVRTGLSEARKLQ